MCAVQIYFEEKEIHALLDQGLHKLEKYLNLEGFLEKSLKMKYALKRTRKSLKCLESP